MSVWTLSFLVVTLIEGLIIVGFERYLLHRISCSPPRQQKMMIDPVLSYVFAEYASSLPKDTLSNPANRYLRPPVTVVTRC